MLWDSATFCTEIEGFIKYHSKINKMPLFFYNSQFSHCENLLWHSIFMLEPIKFLVTTPLMCVQTFTGYDCHEYWNCAVLDDVSHTVSNRRVRVVYDKVFCDQNDRYFPCFIMRLFVMYMRDLKSCNSMSKRLSDPQVWLYFFKHVGFQMFVAAVSSHTKCNHQY